MQSLTVSNKSNVIVHSTVEWEYHMSMVVIYKVLKIVRNFLGWPRCGVGAVWIVKDKTYCIVWICPNRPGKSQQFGSEVEINKISEDMWFDRGWSRFTGTYQYLQDLIIVWNHFFACYEVLVLNLSFSNIQNFIYFFYLHTNFNL